MPGIFITGAVRNTGRAIAELFASRGWSVAITSRVAEDAVTAAKEISEKYGVPAFGYSLNLLDVGDIKRVFAEAVPALGTLDAFVANAANLGVNISVLTATEQDFDDVVGVDLKGNYFCCQQAANAMLPHGGSITIIGSVHGKAAIAGRSLYTTSKGGLNSLAKAMTVELAPLGIRTNVILAGAIRTDRWDKLTDDQVAAKRANWPCGIESTGEEIAEGVWYLAGNAARTVSGAEIAIDSGILASLLPGTSGNVSNLTAPKKNS